MATHIFYIPHPDDETLSMSAAILEKKKQGCEVYFVLLTDGAADETYECLNGAFKCRWHERYHDPQEEHFPGGALSKADFINARRDEFFKAAEIMGISTERIKVFQFSDGSLSTDTVKQIVLQFQNHASLSTPVYHHTMSYKFDAHNDHVSAGTALLDLYREGAISLPTWYVKRSMWNTIHSGAPVIDNVTTKKDDRNSIMDICNRVYKCYEPAKGHFAIGYHSVPESFDSLTNNFTVKCHNIV